MNKRKRLGLASMLMIPATMTMVSLAACEDKGPAEEAGERIDESIEDVGDSMEDAADDIEDGVN